MNGVKHSERIETHDGHVLVNCYENGDWYLTVAGSDTGGNAHVAFVTLTDQARERLRRALGEGYMEKGK